ncbi:MAG: hypothetical protein GY941_12845 [Planctomycetes bacterium]|nr:hypothetical protein [Planctomycetota bacterium]
MITRKQMMNKEYTHQEYYAQFGQYLTKLVSIRIGADRINSSKCEHFNDIPLKEWDSLADTIRQHVGRCMAEANMAGGVSLSDCVCAAKSAATIIRGF